MSSRKGQKHVFNNGLSGDRLDIAMRRLQIVLKHGLFAAARRIIDSAERDLHARVLPVTTDTPLVDTSVGDNARLLNILDSYGIMTVGQFLGISDDKLSVMRLSPAQHNAVRDFRTTFLTQLEQNGRLK